MEVLLGLFDPRKPPSKLVDGGSSGRPQGLTEPRGKRLFVFVMRRETRLMNDLQEHKRVAKSQLRVSEVVTDVLVAVGC